MCPLHRLKEKAEGEGGIGVFWKMVLELSVTLLAVYGVACAARTVTEWLFPQKNLAMAIEIRTEQDAQNLDVLLFEASASVMRRGRSRMIVLIPTDLMSGIMGEDNTLFSEYEELIGRYGADCYMIETDEA